MDRAKPYAAEQWEPYDARVSRTVLREREGAIPSRHSPRCGARQLNGELSFRLRLPVACELLRFPYYVNLKLLDVRCEAVRAK